jgi:UDP-N-acetylmuramoyl-L-alanyl-D-glutamate--2,6-diaminopimelate ligase
MIQPAPRTAALSSLIESLWDPAVDGPHAGKVSGVAYDSRRTEPGDVFVAIPGERADGHLFVPDALARGARAVVVERARFAEFLDRAPGSTLAGVDGTRRALSSLAGVFYGAPSKKLSVAGVTGTNGKTTVTFLIEAIAREAGLAAARIGTLGVAFGGEAWELANTTPMSADVQEILAALVERGAQAAALEVSSHALEQDRVADVAFAAGAFTNLPRDHLDYHGTMEAYAAAKRRLFDLARSAVLNIDDPYGARIARELGSAAITYALDNEADLRARDVAVSAERTAFSLDGTNFELHLRGRFNISNALAAIGCARVFGIDDRISSRALARFERVPGRMETLKSNGVVAIVDYAHTPDALERVLGVARDLAQGRVIAVFGCGGDRDPGKRPQMGAIARRLADIVIVTSDNPRSEDPAAIAAAIVDGAGSGAAVELDRRSAIEGAIARARPGDVVVIAGKGHEAYQIAGLTVTPFDDRKEAAAALARREAAVR